MGAPEATPIDAIQTLHGRVLKTIEGHLVGDIIYVLNFITERLARDHGISEPMMQHCRSYCRDQLNLHHPLPKDLS